MQRNRILLIDDEPDTIYLLRFALERADYEVTTVGTVADAMQAAHAEVPDLILLDLVLGEDNGLDICRSLRANPATSTLPIVLVTGKLRTEFDTVEGFRAGADDYIMKPFRPAEVVARVAAILERTQRHRDTSPVTGQPGPAAINHHLQRLIANNKQDGHPFATLYIDLDSFAVFNRFYGFEKGDGILRQVAHYISDIAKAVDGESFVGHLGGDDWVITTDPALQEPIAHAIIEKFDALRDAWYPPEVIEHGCLTSRDRRGKDVDYPLLSISVVGVTNELRDFHNPLEIAAVATETRKALKLRSGSGYLKDRRADPTR
jgi:diguanylate cyclase (GGDEF)-like protein